MKDNPSFEEEIVLFFSVAMILSSCSTVDQRQ